MTEIVKRSIKAEKTTFSSVDHRLQVSLNSDGRLVIRLIPSGKEDEDILIIFTSWDSKVIKDFIKEQLN